MSYNRVRKILTVLIAFLGFIIFVDLMSLLGAGGVLNELDLALEEIENLEEQNLLNLPPENISESTKFYLSQFHNSIKLKKHIKEYETDLSSRDIYFGIFLLLPICFRKIFSVKMKKYRSLYEIGAPERIRTSDPRIRNPVLYPTELRALSLKLLTL